MTLFPTETSSIQDLAFFALRAQTSIFGLSDRLC